MRPRDIVELVALAALWGGSFLFMRVAVPAFGPFALAFLRVAGAALLLVPLLAARGELGRAAPPLAADRGRRPDQLGAAVPLLRLRRADDQRRRLGDLQLGDAALRRHRRLALARRPPDAAARRRPGDRLRRRRSGSAGTRPTSAPGGSAWAIAACLVATMSYGIAPSLTKRQLGGVPPLAVAAGSQVAAAILLAVPAALAWPAVAPSPHAWLMIARCSPSSAPASRTSSTSG